MLFSLLRDRALCIWRGIAGLDELGFCIWGCSRATNVLENLVFANFASADCNWVCWQRGWCIVYLERNRGFERFESGWLLNHLVAGVCSQCRGFCLQMRRNPNRTSRRLQLRIMVRLFPRSKSSRLWKLGKPRGCLHHGSWSRPKAL